MNESEINYGKEILEKFGVTEEWIESSAKDYEDGTYEENDIESPIIIGSPDISGKFLKISKDYA